MKSFRNAKQFRHSLRFKLVGLVGGITVIAIVAAWIISNNLTKSFYILDARSNLITTYESCNQLFLDASGTPVRFEIAAGEIYDQVENPSNATIFIVDYPNNKIYSSVLITDKVARSLQPIIDSMDYEKLEEGKPHYKFINYEDSFDLVGVLDNGNIIILERPLEQLNSSIRFSTRLFLIVAVVILSFEASLVLFVSGTLTQPIIQMSHAARRMTKLDFDVRAPEDRKDEIGELGHSMNELSMKLEETVSELKSANASLSQDIQEKERIEEMRSEFLSHVSHELKTPLALIQGYAEGLKDSVNDDPESREFYCDVITDEAAKMNTLIMKLLNLNELEFGNEPLKIVRFDVVEQIRGIIAANKILLEQKNVRLTQPENTPVYVWADAFKMSEVFTNYLSNAIHYVKDGGEIRVSVERLANPGLRQTDRDSIPKPEDMKAVADHAPKPEDMKAVADHAPKPEDAKTDSDSAPKPAGSEGRTDELKNVVRVSVYNQGPKLGEEALKKVFVKFYKEDEARTRSYGGSGIGLSIVGAIQKSHGQDYGVYNADDGVVFYYDLDGSSV